MLRYISNTIERLDVSVEKRNDGGYIVVANKLKYLSRGKNVVIYWPTSSSVAVIILGLLPKRTTLYSVADMKRELVGEKTTEKYKMMVN